MCTTSQVEEKKVNFPLILGKKVDSRDQQQTHAKEVLNHHLL